MAFCKDYLNGKNYDRFSEDANSYLAAGNEFRGLASEYARAGLYFSQGRIKCRDCAFDMDMHDKKLCCPRKQHSVVSPHCQYLSQFSIPDHSGMIVKEILYGKGKF